MPFSRVELSLGHSLQRRVTKHAFLAYLRKVGALTLAYPESTEGRPWGQPLKKLLGAPLNLG